MARVETKRVRGGHDEEVVRTGTRVERILKGYACEVIEVEPARTEVVKETITIPARKVTVVADGSEAKPLPGTTQVLTESELKAAVDAP